ncbi:hypothetical protein ACGFX4_38550 [Kitasatospora sp. NPDC048365]|uniref:hypothetical protein n=1 Tax=Kitasatospora sp. NPDC048365 TaxID=3364050 RepID=UPI0037128FA7
MQNAIFVAATPGTTWPLTYQDVERHLEARFPDVRCRHKFAPVSRMEYLDFELTLDDMTRHGSYFDRSHLILRDGSPEFWAATIVWFLGLLPAGAPAVAMVESNPDTATVPPGAGPQDIQQLLDTLLDAE